jgi:hypothetical protein
MGAQRGWSHPSMEPYYACAEEIRLSKHIISYVENSPHFPIGDFTERVAPTKKVVFAIFGPPQIGAGQSRTRMQVAALDQDRTVWLGQDGDCTTHFLHFFHSRVKMEGIEFAGNDTPENIRLTRQAYAVAKGVELTEFMTTRDLLCASAQVHLDGYREIQKADRHRTGSLGGMIADVSQRPGHMKRCGAWLPALTCSSQLIAMFPSLREEDDHIFTPNELAFAHGFPSLPEPNSPMKFQLCLNFDLASLPRRESQKILGNGFHLIAQTAWWLYVLAFSCQRETLKLTFPILRLTSLPITDSDDEEF